MSDSTTPASEQDFSSLMRLATYASVTVAGVLIVFKLAAWLLTDSVALMSSLVDSVLDVCASLVNLFAIRHALQPADREHRFGHGKAESLAGLAQAAFIAGSGVFLLLEAVGRFIEPREVENGAVGVIVMAGSVVLTAILVAFQSHVVRKTGSIAIRADSIHYRVDILVNLAVIASLLLVTYVGWGYADPLFAIAIVIYMAHGAASIARQSFDVLMDKEFSNEERNRIHDIAMEHPMVKAVHDMRTRSSGPYSFIQLHLEMARELTLVEAHRISDDVMYKVERAFPKAEVLIHQDPEGEDERRDDVEY